MYQTISKLQLQNSIMGKTTNGSPLYAMQAVHSYIDLQGFREFAADYITDPASGNTSQQHNQTNSHITVRVSAA
jgi:hypothetical protein